ncbi:MAG: sugar ABC transporter permease [Actinobacteria bacterium]|nr:sugar ABC transporter permease [Actinomycetota bacterium]
MTTTATRDKKSRRRRAFTRGDRFTLSMFVGVPTFLHLTWVWFPALATIGLSFTYWNGVHLSDIKWAGLANYNTIFTASPQFYAALRNNGYWLLWFTFIATPLGILLAYQIDRKIRGSKVYESVYYIPVVLSLAVIGIIWRIVFPSMKPVNTIVIVITVIESLRAFDLIYIIYGTSTGWPILGMLVFTNIYGQAASMLGAAFAVILFVLSITPIVFYLKTVFSDENR